MPNPIQLGRKERMTFGKINEVAEMPNLIDIQTASYKWFVEEGLREVFEDISPIKDYSDNLILEFLDYTVSDVSKYDEEECKERDATYAAPIRVKVRLVNKETGEVKEQEVFMGDFPLMTDKGTFVYNGAERVIVTQLVRSPGPYYDVTSDTKGKKNLYSTTVIPNRGAWLEYETDSNEVISVRVDRTRKQPVTTLLRALGMGSDAEIIDVFGDEPRLRNTLDKDTTSTYEEGLKEIYKKLRPGEPPTVDSAQSLFNSMFFDPKRYDLAKVGRYKYNKKLGLYNRIVGVVTNEDIFDLNTGELLAEAGQKIDKDLALQIENAGTPFIMAQDPNNAARVTKVIGNRFVDLDKYIEFDVSDLKLADRVYYPVLKEILEENEDEESIRTALKLRKFDLSPKHVLVDDIIASVSYLLNLDYGIGRTDDIDHLGNRRLRTVGELLQNQVRIGLSRMERTIKERMTTQDITEVTPQGLMNIRPVTAAVKEF
ncbi:MAG: DNA-directed RNA polymerase subunit beta, partial [Eubacterium sp.]|nr:DNA-directed RNA polymerase subunit beta [Candidatus Colimonas fimequi]